ncbi:MAG TPA: N-formylglutamate amidohydrolase [Caulobacteraceae bacterium]
MPPAKPAVKRPDAKGNADPGARDSGEPATFEVRRGARLSTPLVFASPHSGRVYPQALLLASALDGHALRRSEDALVDDLIEPAFARGVAGVLCKVARVYVDVNRDPWELDPAMFDGRLPAYARSQSARVAAGLGSIAKVVGEGQEVYARKLSFAEVKARIEAVHQPYHKALGGLLSEARKAFGVAVLIDWHSMPSAASRSEAQRGRVRPDIVLGDRHGAACGRRLSQAMRGALEGMGYVVGMNTPYAGGYTTETYGRPHGGYHALQVEIDRSIYLNEASLEPSAGFARVRQDLEQVCETLLQTDWKQTLRS